jgi:hypothetical protein
MKWKDKRSVYLLSNFHSPKDTMQVNRKEKDGQFTVVPCPLALNDYNKCMNYVDKFEMKAVYSINRKSKKWWHRIFFHLLDVAVVNSFITYRELYKIGKVDNDIKLKEFRRLIYRGLLSD